MARSIADSITALRKSLKDDITALKNKKVTAPETLKSSRVYSYINEINVDTNHYLRPGTAFVDKNSFHNLVGDLSIQKIYFVKNRSYGSYNPVDVSEAQDGSILAWKEGTTLYVSSPYIIFGSSRYSDFYGGYFGEGERSKNKFLNVTDIVFENFSTEKMTSLSELFYGLTSLKNIVGLENWCVSNCTQMSKIFCNCSSLQTLEGINNWDLNSCRLLDYAFSNCSSLISLDLTGWSFGDADGNNRNQGKSVCFNYTFQHCTNLKAIYAQDWDHYSFDGNSVWMFSNSINLPNYSEKYDEVNQNGLKLNYNYAKSISKGGFFSTK